MTNDIDGAGGGDAPVALPVGVRAAPVADPSSLVAALVAAAALVLQVALASVVVEASSFAFIRETVLAVAAPVVRPWGTWGNDYVLTGFVIAYAFVASVLAIPALAAAVAARAARRRPSTPSTMPDRLDSLARALRFVLLAIPLLVVVSIHLDVSRECARTSVNSFAACFVFADLR